MSIPPDVLYQSFFEGLATVLTFKGILFMVLIFFLCALGILFRSRIPLYLSVVISVMVLFLNLHFTVIFPVSGSVRYWITQPSEPYYSPMIGLVGFLGRSLFNLGLILIPLLAALVSLRLTNPPIEEELEWYA
ncbi:MAG: hypothetical protein GTO18_13260 [Anaerolineales bacterium]|nr:hypothetical protein [Anaerolineales bacterium]